MPGAEKRRGGTSYPELGQRDVASSSCAPPLEGDVWVRDPETFVFSSSGASVPLSGKGRRVRAARLL